MDILKKISLIIQINTTQIIGKYLISKNVVEHFEIFQK